MSKSKSFKSLSDLKDINLFGIDNGQPINKPNSENLKSQAKSSLDVQSPSSVLPANKVLANDSLQGTKDQETSYQSRLDWLNKRAEELSLSEVAFAAKQREFQEERQQFFSKQTLIEAENQKELQEERRRLIAMQALVESEKTVHKVRLLKLDQLDELESDISRREAALVNLTLTLDKKSETLMVREEELIKEQRAFSSQLKKALSEAAKAKSKSESLEIKIADLKKHLAAEVTSKNNLQIEIREANATINTLEEKLFSYVKVKFDIWDVVEFITKNGANAADLGYENKKILLCGDAPWFKKDFIGLLKKKGFTPVSSISSDVEIAVVGRDFDPEEVEGQLVLRQGERIHFYSQELLIATIAAGVNPFDNPRSFKSLFKEFAEDHPGLQFLKNNFKFPWPLPNISDSVILFFDNEGLVDQSPLVSVGYRVGRERGLDEHTRREILRDSFYGLYDDTDEWYVHSDVYMKRWDRPQSRGRLFQMAHHIHSLIINRRSVPSMKQAVQEWEDDLRWLKKFYKPYMGFKWPVLK
jgi:hypothetical protein